MKEYTNKKNIHMEKYTKRNIYIKGVEIQGYSFYHFLISYIILDYIYLIVLSILIRLAQISLVPIYKVRFRLNIEYLSINYIILYDLGDLTL